MVTGHLREKNGVYHIVFNYKDENGKRQTPSKSTGLPVKGNKKKAELMLREAIKEKEAELLCDKILRMRIFSDENGKMNLSVTDEKVKGDLMVVSNFTLYANCKSRRPDFLRAGKPAEANRLYEYFLACIKDTAKKISSENASAYIPEIKTGVFGADMQINLINDGPVTIILDTDELKNGGRSAV